MLKINKYTILIFLLYSWLIVITISGYFLNKNIYILGNTFSALFLGAVFIYLLFSVNYKRYLLYILILTFLILASIHTLNSLNQGLIFYYQKTSRVLYPILLYFFIREMLIKEQISIQTIRRIIILNSLILIANTSLYYFDIGFGGYGISEGGQDLGGVGFFYAGNALSGTIIILLSMVIILYNHLPWRYMVLIFVAFLIGTIPLFSKASLVGIIVTFLFFIINFIKKRNLPILLISFLFIGYILYIYIFEDFFKLMTGRWQFFIDKYGAATYLMGGEKRLTEISDFLTNISNEPLTLFYGFGWKGNTENNFFDLLQGYGIWGLLILIIWAFWLVKYIKLSIKKKENIYRFISLIFILIIGISYFAGHLIQSASLAPFIALFANSDKIIEKIKNYN